MTECRKGDKGKTCILGEITTRKCDCRIECLGAYDELNSFLGIALQFDESGEISPYIKETQNDLFTVCAEIAASLTEKPFPKITAKHVLEIEQAIDKVEAIIKIPESFVIPGGTKLSAMLDYSRTLARRAERELIRLKAEQELDENLLHYANRISDLLYHLARLANKNVKEGKPVYRHAQ
jgi:cob(I)alamin adenosyltransferase